ncbi:hypothetical protein GUITHDRAFT_156381 [Guillardia theta CCMP2712]|uniref:Uncharacterized protein n=1 Tax=Guillardia theta (strain CCMP2712) TaxID=905079 RepID=L1I8Q8_GUITC|nr:hypothetical protein GUITHDRAFT_156381 [Guillardia theta CCMP2712]EKX32264.1 hypothetical protein GUITHDRAFT_156381 [Guillardia theta CCMP2712]|eukprot:XP_005819244.1 hypothetical protein GUITHDRAFT_156381 [Guillardia theta CCMP2712]
MTKEKLDWMELRQELSDIIETNSHIQSKVKEKEEEEVRIKYVIRPHAKLYETKVSPPASTRPPSFVNGKRVKIFEGWERRGQTAYKQTASSTDEDEDEDDEKTHKLDIKSRVWVACKDTVGADGDNAEAQQAFQSIHQFTQAGAGMLQAALRPGDWYLSTSLGPGLRFRLDGDT